MAPNFRFFLLTLLLIHTLVVSAKGKESELIFVSPRGKTLSGKDFDPSSLAKTAATTATAAAQSGSTAAQAVSAAAQAGMMYRLLMAQGVMDYLHRKQLDKANQKMAEKMERLEKELRAGKLNSAQFAAIKSAVDEAYQENAQTQAAQNDFPQSPNEASEQIPTGASQLSSDSSSNLASMNDPSDKSSSNPSDVAALAALSNQAASEKKPKTAGTESPVKNQEGGSSSDPRGSAFISPHSWVLIQKDYQEKNTELETEQNPTMGLTTGGTDYQDVRKTLLREMSSETLEETVKDNLIHNESTAEGGQDITNESWALYDQSKGDSGPSLLRGTAKKLNTFSLAEISGGLKKLFKPIKIQKSPFSLEPYSEEEGLHWGFLILGLAVAYGWGKKKASVKSKIPHIIPEVVLAPQTLKNRGLKDRRQITRS